MRGANLRNALHGAAGADYGDTLRDASHWVAVYDGAAVTDAPRQFVNNIKPQN